MDNPTTTDHAMCEGSRKTQTGLRGLVHERACTLARAHGRTPISVSQYDYERAKLEVTGEPDLERQQLILDSPPAPRPQAGVQSGDAAA
jgi:hypothetical protein